MSKMARLIDAEELLAKHTCDVYGAYDDSCMVQAVFVPYIKGAPTVDAVPVVHGRWRKTYTCNGERLWGYECSQCKADNPRASYYCPNCGAKMDQEVE